MDDTISRQAAIEALDGEIEVTGKANAKAVLKYTQMVSDRIKALPPAQPEPRWIPVSEKPMKNGEYLVTMIDHITHDRIVDIAGYGNFIHSNNGFHKADEVTAWMPLPESYRGGEE